jgi:iron complex outermembrane receptor protein
LSASGPLAALAQGAFWFVKLNNATNELAYNASTIETLRGLAPLPGRALAAGVQLRF